VLAAQDEDGWTALIAATCYDHDDVVQVPARRTTRALMPLTLGQELLEAGQTPTFATSLGCARCTMQVRASGLKLHTTLKRSSSGVFSLSLQI